MPRYHFNVFDGYGTPDLEGTELPNRHAARREAIRLAGALLLVEGCALATDWYMEVTDDAGLILFRLDFTVLEAQPRAMRDPSFNPAASA